MASLVLFASCMVSSCKDDDNDSSAKAVLASAKSLTFEGIGSAPQVITVYSDAQWNAEVPEWISISPATGSGTTEVTVSVSENLREGTLDNPRKAQLVFKGNTIASRAVVIVSQTGDNYRDCKDYTVEQLYSAPDEVYMSVPNALVVTKTTKGCIITNSDYKGYIYVETAEPVEVGDNVSFMAQKLSDSQKLAYIKAEEVSVNSKNNAIDMPEPLDITDRFSDYTSAKREYVVVEGVLSGNVVTVNGASLSLSLVDVPESVNIAALNGHIVKAKGFFAGVASPFSRMHLEGLDDLGEAMTIYWSEDFEWLDPYAVAAGAGRSVENDDVSANAPQISASGTKVDGLTACDALEARGYQMLRVTTKKEGECIYLQQNYLKMGKTSYQGGIILPAIDGIPEGTSNLRIAFDWCPMRQGSGKIDPVNLIVIVENNGEETTFSVPTHGWANDHKLEWINATVELAGATVTKDTKITIRQTEWPAATANRWFIDNIKVYSPMM